MHLQKEGQPETGRVESRSRELHPRRNIQESATRTGTAPDGRAPRRPGGESVLELPLRNLIRVHVVWGLRSPHKRLDRCSVPAHEGQEGDCDLLSGVPCSGSHWKLKGLSGHKRRCQGPGTRVCLRRMSGRPTPACGDGTQTMVLPRVTRDVRSACLGETGRGLFPFS